MCEKACAAIESSGRRPPPPAGRSCPTAPPTDQGAGRRRAPGAPRARRRRAARRGDRPRPQRAAEQLLQQRERAGEAALLGVPSERLARALQSRRSTGSPCRPSARRRYSAQPVAARQLQAHARCCRGRSAPAARAPSRRDRAGTRPGLRRPPRPAAGRAGSLAQRERRVGTTCAGRALIRISTARAAAAPPATSAARWRHCGSAGPRRRSRSPASRPSPAVVQGARSRRAPRRPGSRASPRRSSGSRSGSITGGRDGAPCATCRNTG